jgi:hypothetical protein
MSLGKMAYAMHFDFKPGRMPLLQEWEKVNNWINLFEFVRPPRASGLGGTSV